jgi:uncharacterized membrane protein (UPF0127 family)
MNKAVIFMNKFLYEKIRYPERGENSGWPGQLACPGARSAQEAARGFTIQTFSSKFFGCFLWPMATRTTSCPGYPNRVLVVILGFCLAVALPIRAQTGPTDTVEPMAKVTLHLGKASLATEIASTPAQQERGLMYVSKLPDNGGMIFLLPQVTTATFWMKNTLIPLSIAFIDKNGVILEIHDMKALDETITRSDSDKVAYALETNLHWFALNGVKPGDKIDPAPGTLGSEALIQQLGQELSHHPQQHKTQ